MLNPDLLRTFLAVVASGSFSRAGRQLGLSQSTISQHIGRLEAALGRSLVIRDTHHVATTPDGDALTGFARQVIDSHERLERFFEGEELRGQIRLGAGEDFILARVSTILAEFARRHASVDVHLTVGLSGALYERFDAGELDVIFVKRRKNDDRGTFAWREQVSWVGRPGVIADSSLAVPLVLYPPPSVTRTLAVDALEAAGRRWRVACTSGSLAGIRAAVLAGLGVAPHSARLLPPGLVPLPPECGLPPLGIVEFVVIGPGGHNPIARALIQLVLEGAASLNGHCGT